MKNENCVYLPKILYYTHFHTKKKSISYLLVITHYDENFAKTKCI